MTHESDGLITTRQGGHRSQLAGFILSLFVVISLEKVCLGADVNNGCAPVHSWRLSAVLTESG